MTTERILLDTGPSPRGWHRLQLFLECPQKFAWKFLVPPGEQTERPALVIGSLVHLGLAHHYARLRAEQQQADKDAYYTPTEALQVAAERHGGLWKETIATAQPIVDAYIRYFAFERVRPLHVEELMQGQFGGFPYTARADAIWEGSNKKIYIVDHKTTSRIEAKHALFYSVSGQLVAMQWLGLLLFKEAFGGVLVNLIQTTQPFTFKRIPLQLSPAMHAAFPQTVVDAEMGIQRLIDSGRDPTQWPRAMNEHTCFGRYGACEHIDKCKWGKTDT